MKRIYIMMTVVAFFFLGSLAQAAESIKIGVLLGLNGPEEHIAKPAEAAVKMAAEAINAGGGILGRPIELVFGNTQSNPVRASIEVQRLLDREKVTAIIGPTGTGSALAVLRFIQNSRIPTVGLVGGTQVVEPVRQFMFKSPQKTVTAVECIYTYLRDKGVKKIAIMTAWDNFGQEGKDSLERLAPAFGIEIVNSQVFIDTLYNDMGYQLMKIKQADPQAVVCWTIGKIGATLTRDFRKMGLSIPLIHSFGLADPRYLELAGSAAEGIIMPTVKLMVHDQISENDPQKAMLVKFRDDYENKKKIGQIGAHSGYAWDAMQLLALGLRKTGGKGGLELARAIEDVKDYVGVSGIYRMSARDHCGLGVDSMVMVEVKNGKWTLIK